MREEVAAKEKALKGKEELNYVKQLEKEMEELTAVVKMGRLGS